MLHKKSAIALTGMLVFTTIVHAQIFRWDNDQLIPGTQEIKPGAGVSAPEQTLSYAQLSGVNLTGSNFRESDLAYADFSGAILIDAVLEAATLESANFEQATIDGLHLNDTTSKGFSSGQLYSTDSYQRQRLTSVELNNNNLAGWNFSTQDLSRATIWSSNLSNTSFRDANLTDAILASSILTGADLNGATITGAVFEASDEGLTPEQLYSTKSYQDGDLSGVTFRNSEMIGWDFQGQKLVGARFNGTISADFTDADLSGATLLLQIGGSNFDGAIITDAQLGTTQFGFRKEQLYSTKSYQDKDLTGIVLQSSNLSGWDFSGQRLVNADFYASGTNGTDFRGADLRNARLDNSNGLFDTDTIFNQWTIFPEGFTPDENGLTFVESRPGDANADEVLDLRDVNPLLERIQSLSRIDSRYDNPRYDLDNDLKVTTADLAIWVKDLKKTWFGDANLDGLFDSNDLVSVFAAAEYEDGIRGNSSWETGDWNGDGEFDSGDFVVAFADGGYEMGVVARTQSVPEPHLRWFTFLLLTTLFARRPTQRS